AGWGGGGGGVSGPQPAAAPRRAVVEEAPRARRLHERVQAASVGAGRLADGPREPVDRAARVGRRLVTGVGPLDQAVDEHPVDRAVERPRTDVDATARQPLDLGHDRVAVRLPGGEDEEDVERRRGKRQQVFCGRRRHAIYPSWIYLQRREYHEDGASGPSSRPPRARRRPAPPTGGPSGRSSAGGPPTRPRTAGPAASPSSRASAAACWCARTGRATPGRRTGRRPSTTISWSSTATGPRPGPTIGTARGTSSATA